MSVSCPARIATTVNEAGFGIEKGNAAGEPGP
jgi:hypothetical protein